MAAISVTGRDRAKRTKFGDHIQCQRSQLLIFEHFENLKKKNLLKFKIFKFALISETVRDRAKRSDL